MTKKHNSTLLNVRDRRTHIKEKVNEEEKENNQKTAFLYIRVSTDEQADRGFSQRDQDQRLHEYCQRQNIRVGRVIYEIIPLRLSNVVQSGQKCLLN